MPHDILYSDLEIQDLLYKGVWSEVYAQASPEATKVDIERWAKAECQSISPKVARRLVSFKVCYPEASFLKMLEDARAPNGENT